MKSKKTAYLLWFLGGLGILGLHRFYLNKIGTGIIWLVSGGVLMFGALFDLVTLSYQVDQYNLRSDEEHTTITYSINSEAVQPKDEVIN
ncbi:MAG: TM2 domain-containing protein [Spirochaetes bacterium]|nr:TM2 domain-containing protein [Spirochaetota bacterium]